MPYYINNRKLAQDPKFTIIGCGGTGGFTAEALCRLLTGTPAEITLVDHDRVEPHNLLRQNFVKADIGRPKSQALAERLACQFDRPINYSTYPLAEQNNGITFPLGLESYNASKTMVIGCVDNAPARRAMAHLVDSNQCSWLVDAGNGSTWGQVLIGNTTRPDHLKDPFWENLCHTLPAPTLQRPDLLTQLPEPHPDIDCAAAVDLTDQDPTINHFMASLTVHAIRQILAGTCTFMALYLDLQQGTVAPQPITPQAVSAFAA